MARSVLICDTARGSLLLTPPDPLTADAAAATAGGGWIRALAGATAAGAGADVDAGTIRRMTANTANADARMTAAAAIPPMRLNWSLRFSPLMIGLARQAPTIGVAPVGGCRRDPPIEDEGRHGLTVALERAGDDRDPRTQQRGSCRGDGG
jgi:hypothetical protein